MQAALSAPHTQQVSTFFRKIDWEFLLPAAKLSRQKELNREGTCGAEQAYRKEVGTKAEVTLVLARSAGFGDSVTLGLAAQVAESP